MRKLILEELPEQVSEVADRRCKALIEFTVRAGRNVIRLDDLARSAYLQGFYDAFVAATSLNAKRTEHEIVRKSSKPIRKPA